MPASCAGTAPDEMPPLAAKISKAAMPRSNWNSGERATGRSRPRAANLVRDAQKPQTQAPWPVAPSGPGKASGFAAGYRPAPTVLPPLLCVRRANQARRARGSERDPQMGYSGACRVGASSDADGERQAVDSTQAWTRRTFAAWLKRRAGRPDRSSKLTAASERRSTKPALRQQPRSRGCSFVVVSWPCAGDAEGDLGAGRMDNLVRRCCVVAALASLAAAAPVSASLSGSAQGAAGPQWVAQRVPDPPSLRDTGANLIGVSCPSESYCAAVGISSAGSTSPAGFAEGWTDHGGWAVQQTPTVSDSTLSAVSCSSMSACTAVGSSNALGDSLPLVELWNGSQWSLESAPNPAGMSHVQLDAVSCPTARTCIAVGSGGFRNQTVLVAERWNGLSWSAQTLPAGGSDGNGGPLTGVSCVSTATCLAVGYNNRGPLSLGWNGIRWVSQGRPISTDPSEFSDVSCSSSSSCIAVGAQDDGLTLAERWNGSGWSVEPTPALIDRRHGGTSSLDAVSCVSARFCVAVGSITPPGSSSPTKVVAETWNGADWVADKGVSTVGLPYLSAVSCASDNACTAVGSNGNGLGEPFAERYAPGE